jgi:heme exporter protein D
MSWYVWVAIIAVIVFFTYVITVITGLFKRNADLTQENIDELERQRQIENGVIKNNVKADNAKSGSDLDNSVREKYGSR